jgi:hypothetical protein
MGTRWGRNLCQRGRVAGRRTYSRECAPGYFPCDGAAAQPRHFRQIQRTTHRGAIAGVLLFLAFIDRGRIVCAKKPLRLGPSKILLHKGTAAAQPVAESWHNPSRGALGIAPLSPELDPAAAGLFVGQILNPRFLSATIIEPQEPWVRVSDAGTLRFNKQLEQRRGVALSSEAASEHGACGRRKKAFLSESKVGNTGTA